MSKLPKSLTGFNELSDAQLAIFYSKLKTSKEFRDEFEEDIEKLRGSVQNMWNNMADMTQSEREEVTALARIVAYGTKVIEDLDKTHG